jgi:hypothetical protein
LALALLLPVEMVLKLLRYFIFSAFLCAAGSASAIEQVDYKQVRCSEFLIIYDWVQSGFSVKDARTKLEARRIDEERIQKWGPLAQVRQNQEMGAPGTLKPNETTLDLINAFLEATKDLSPGRAYPTSDYNIGDMPSQLLRLIGLDSYNRFRVKNPNKSMMELYGIETMHSWKEADDFLTSIPIGKFDLSLGIIQKMGNLSGRTVGVLPTGFSFTKGFEFNRGSFKAFPNIGREPLTKELSEDQFLSLKQNPWIHKFWELPYPYSRKGARRGAIIYALPWEVKPKLNQLIQWYHSNKESMDPIALAAQFQLAFVSIHPFVDGNGRASRLLMDRILMEKGLPAPLLLDHNRDIYLDIKTYESMVRAGVSDMINLYKQEAPNFSYLLKVPGSVVNKTIGFVNGNVDLVKRFGLVRKQIELKNFKLSIGNRVLRLEDNGFFYDQFNIPYQYHEGRLYPIADRTVPFYDFGGPLNVDSNVIRPRSTTEVKEALVLEHIQLIEKLMDNKVSVDQLSIEDFSNIAKYNRAGKAFLYPWQKAQFLRLLKIRSEDPLNMLAPYGAGSVPYTEYSNTSGKNLPLAIAQYERIDLDLVELQAATAKNSSVWKAIYDQRVALHKAGRALVDSFKTDLSKLSEEDINFIRKDFRYKLTIDYLKISKLYHKTFAEAEAAGATKYVPLIRSANRSGTSIGFVPTKFYRAIALSIPGSKELVQWADKTLQMFERSPDKLDSQISKMLDFAIWLKPEAKIALKEKMIAGFPTIKIILSQISSGLFVDGRARLKHSLAGERFKEALMARAGGGDNQYFGLSFSTNPALYFHNSIFAQGNPNEVGIYLIKAPYKSVRLNHVSGFSAEFEVIGVEPILPTHKAKVFSSADRGLEGFDKYGVGAFYVPNENVKSFMESNIGLMSVKVGQSPNDSPKDAPDSDISQTSTGD